MTAPLDRWRVCGHRVDSVRKNRGCTCGPNDPTRRLATEAIARLGGEREEGGRDAAP